MKIFILFSLLIILGSCDQFSRTNKTYGEDFDASKAIRVNELMQKMDSVKEMKCVIKGIVTTECKKEGCWVRLEDGIGSDLFVSTEEKFFLPKDLEGKELIVNGVAFHDTTSVEKLKDYAKDENKSEEEIAKIISPKIEISFMATGIMIK